MTEPDEPICGESYDHTPNALGLCAECDAELWDDSDEGDEEDSR